MNDKKLKDMWNKAAYLMGASDYKSSNIEQFLSGRSHNTARMIKKMIYMDIVIKTIVAIVLVIDIFLYAGTVNVIMICSSGIVLLGGLIVFQLKMLTRFSDIADEDQTTRDKLTSMLAYLKTRFYSTLLTISITYLFVFIAGTLVYFYSVYGEVRPLDLVDVVVFSAFILVGIGFNYFTFRAQVNYHVKHLNNCLADLNDDNLILLAKTIEQQRKQDRINKLLLMLVFVFGFVILIAIFMNLGFSG
nr:hypothetical protein [uncultured Draconibacterium sp.]